MVFDVVWDNALIFRRVVFESYRGAFAFWVSIEKHSSECCCSYCREATGPFGICLPESKVPSAWRRFYFSWVSGKFHIRTTLPEWACTRTSVPEKVAMRLRGLTVREWK